MQTGTQLGPYRITSRLGAGGMGEVYRATDTRLDRNVAIKVLPEHLASDPSRRERFEREAKAVSSLNHPHICTLYDVGEQDGTHYLVMELVEGETLESRLSKGRLPLEKALEYAAQIADALDKAHRQGVVHRDLKPGNIMLTRSGVKLLDFGLAKLRGDVSPTSGLSQASTQDTSLTAEGTILGTLQYMAPEQLEGEEVDSRTDIFAFGAVVYEMVTGKKAFEGNSHASLIGAIMNSEPQPMGELQAMTPRPLEHVVRRCLAKDPDHRWQSASDAMREVQWASEGESVVRPGSGNSFQWRSALAGGLAAAAIAVVVMLVMSLPEPPATTPIWLTVDTAPGTSVFGGRGIPFAVSPDATRIAIVGVASDGSRQLWLRSFDSETAQPVSGTEGANGPFWSSDGQWIGFFVEDRLVRVPVSGGTPQVIATGVRDDMSSGATGGADWNQDDVILFKAEPNSGLARVSVSGGPIMGVTQLDSERGEFNHQWPHFLDDGRSFVYTALGAARSGVYLASLDGGEPRLLMEFDALRRSNVRYVPGALLFVEDGALFATPFDERSLRVSDETFRILDGVPAYGPGLAQFSVSAGGLAYWRGCSTGATALTWFDRDGTETGTVASTAPYNGYAISGDSRWLAMSRCDENGSRDIWIRNLLQGQEEKVTFDGDSFYPEWSPRADRVAFASARLGPPDLFTKTVGGTGEERQLTDLPGQQVPTSWSSGTDADWIVYESVDPTTRNDLWAVRPEGGIPVRLSINTPFGESQGKLSPDGRWLAYVSDETGRTEVMVASFPSTDLRLPVSIDGGTMPEWRQDAGELYYRSGQGSLVAVAFDPGGEAPLIGRQEDLFPIPPRDVSNFSSYTTTADGQRFLVAMPTTQGDRPIGVVLNWAGLAGIQ